MLADYKDDLEKKDYNIIELTSEMVYKLTSKSSNYWLDSRNKNL